MSYAAARVGRLYIVRWFVPTEDDARPLLDAVARGHRELGQKLFFVSFVLEESPPPDAATRRAFTAAFDELFEHTERGFAVMEGDGVSTTLKRTIFRAMLAMTRFRDKMSVVSTMDELLDLLGGAAGAPRAQVLGTAARLRVARLEDQRSAQAEL